jgi:protein-arginine kinase activator protein McsA
LNIPPFEEKPLEEQLYDAVVDENFEKAAVLRDKIAEEKKKNKKITKKA